MKPNRNKSTNLTCKAFVFNKSGKFLAIRRTETAPTNPLKWDLPGGIVDFGEDPAQSVVREIKEESGLIIRNLKLLDIESRIWPGIGCWIGLAWKAKIAGGKLKLSYKHNLYKWITANEFLKLDATRKTKKFARTLKNLKTK